MDDGILSFTYIIQERAGLFGVPPLAVLSPCSGPRSKSPPLPWSILDLSGFFSSVSFQLYSFLAVTLIGAVCP